MLDKPVSKHCTARTLDLFRHCFINVVKAIKDVPYAFRRAITIEGLLSIQGIDRSRALGNIQVVGVGAVLARENQISNLLAVFLLGQAVMQPDEKN